MRARMALLASGIVCELREVVLRDKPAEMLALSPKGTVPVLILPSGQVLEQSLDIALWALSTRDPDGWLAAQGPLRDATLHWIAQCDGDFKHHLDRYKYPHRYALPDGLAHRMQGAEFLHGLNAHLADHASLGHAGWGLADAALAPFVRQWAHTDTAWFAAQPWPALQQWLADFEASAAFAQIMHKNPAWVAGAATLHFP
jgi:glutathione S-transferase